MKLSETQRKALAAILKGDIWFPYGTTGHLMGQAGATDYPNTYTLGTMRSLQKRGLVQEVKDLSGRPRFEITDLGRKERLP